jgi:hypothetical protein
VKRKPHKLAVTRLTPYGAVTPTAIAAQLEARIRTAREDEVEIVGVMACVIEKSERGNNTYIKTMSSMPVEVALLAVHELKRMLFKRTEYEDPDDGDTPDRIA